MKKISLIILILICSMCLLFVLVRVLLLGYILNVQNYLDISEQFNLIDIANERIQQALDYEMGVENLPLSLVEDLVSRADIEFGFFERIENVIGYIKGDTLGIATYDPELYAWKFKVALDDYINQLPYKVHDSKVEEVVANVNSVIYNEIRANMHQIDFNFLQYSQSLEAVINFVQFVNNPVILTGVVCLLCLSLYGLYALSNHSLVSCLYWTSITVIINSFFFKFIIIYLKNYSIHFNLMKINEINDAINYFMQGMFRFVEILSFILFIISVMLYVPRFIIYSKKMLKKKEKMV